MPTSRATARSVTASCEPVRSISASAAETMSSVSRPPWPRAFRCLRAAPEAGPAEAGLAEAGPAEAGLAEAGPAEAGLAEAGLAEADARPPGGDFAASSNDSMSPTLHLLAHLSM